MLNLLLIGTLLGRNLWWRRLPRVIFMVGRLSGTLNQVLDALIDVTDVLLLLELLLILSHWNLLQILWFIRHELLLHLIRCLLLILVRLLDIKVSEGILHLRLFVHIHESKLETGQLV